MTVALPAPYDNHVRAAFLALKNGTANEGQQKRALQWLIFNACHIGMVSYATNEWDRGFLEGQRSIGVQIGRILEPMTENPAPKRKTKAEARGT